MSKERIVNSALRWGKVVFTLDFQGRHDDIFNTMMANGNAVVGAEQGFLTSWGRFVDRNVGLAIASLAGQIIKKHPRLTELYSEDMW